VDNEPHSYLPLASFPIISQPTRVLAGRSVSVQPSNAPLKQSWAETTRIVDKVHKHTCGHSTYGDIRTLLQRNGIWNDEVRQYLAESVERCPHCLASAQPQPNRKVALSTLNRSFTDVVCVDHFYLEQLRLFHVMDVYSRFSAAGIVDDASLPTAVLSFDAVWLSHFWPPAEVQGDPAFNHEGFLSYLKSLDTAFRPVPPRRHQKNTLEPKHGVIRSIFLRLRSAAPDTDGRLHALQAVRISNDLYGSDTASAFELAKGFSKPIVHHSCPSVLPDDVVRARDVLLAKRKLTLIMRPKSTSEPTIHVGDLVQVFHKLEKEKRGKWLSPRTVLSIDREAGIVSVPGADGRKICAAVEDVRAAIVDDEFAQMVQETRDSLDVALEECLDSLPDGTDDETVNTDSGSNDQYAALTGDDSEIVMPTVGDNIDVYWPLDNAYCVLQRHRH